MPERKPRRPFVILRHDLAEGRHWDLMLDMGDSLATWQVQDDPAAWASADMAGPIPATRLADHRRAYLEYQGPISGGRGSVTRVDRGEWVPIDQQPDAWTVQLTGSLLSGTFELAADGKSSEQWFIQRLSW